MAVPYINIYDGTNPPYSTGGFGGRPVSELFSGAPVTPQMISSTVGTGGNDTTIFQALWEEVSVYVPPGDYLIDPHQISTAMNVVCAPDAIFTRRSGTNATSRLIEFVAGSEGSRWQGGIVDDDRAGFRAQYLAYGATPVWSGFAVLADNVSVADLTVRNGTYVGFLGQDAEGLRLRNIRQENCSTGGLITCEDAAIDGWTAVNSDNDGLAIDVRGLTINDQRRGHFRNIRIKGVTGDTAVPSGTDTVTGLLAFDLYDTTLSDVWVESMTGDIDHLGVSIIGAWSSHIRGVSVIDYAGTGIELIGLEDTIFEDWLADAKFHETSHSAEGSNVGLILHGAPWYPIGDRHVAIRARHRTTIGAGKGTRCGVGITNRTSGVTFLPGVKANGNQGNGIRHEKMNVILSASFPNAIYAVPYDCHYSDIEANHNSLQGLSYRAGSLTVHGGRFIGNGQLASAAASARAGIGYAGSDTVERLILKASPVTEDRQTYTITDGASFRPGASGQDWPNNDMHTFTISLMDCRKVEINQTFTLTNVTGSGDLTCQIVDILRDEAVVRLPAGAATFSATGNTTALTGTWSCASSATTITGTGGAASTEITGPFWLTDGAGNYWSCRGATAADTILIVGAAGVTLSGATLYKISVDMVAIPSQTYGAWGATANLAELHLGSELIAADNVTGESSFGSVPSVVGKLYERPGRTFVIADDAATSFTPKATSGLLKVWGNSLAYMEYHYQTTPSAQCVPVSGVAASGTGTSGANMDATTGVLAGTTGTDGLLTVSPHTDGKIYIENRRNSSQTVRVTEISNPG